MSEQEERVARPGEPLPVIPASSYAPGSVMLAVAASPVSKKAPLSAKVTNGALTGTAVTFITWALTDFIPAWHNGIPAPLAQLLPGVVGAVGYFVGGYLSKHQATVGEVTTAIADAESIVSNAVEAGSRVAPPSGQTSPAGGAHATG